MQLLNVSAIYFDPTLTYFAYSCFIYVGIVKQFTKKMYYKLLEAKVPTSRLVRKE